MPWIQGKVFAAMHRSYARLRSRLIPYLYSWAYEATRSGRPLMLPLAMEFPDEAETRGILTQYLLGRDLMVTAYAADAYFPRGRWKDFWTGELVDGGACRPIAWPDDRGGGLYVREGGIVPLGPLMQYRGELPLDAIELYAFPGPLETSFTLYRDDGTSLEHRKGRFATTTVTARRNDGGAVVTVGPTEGSYDGQPPTVRWTFTIALDRRPAAVTADGEALADGAWDFDEARRELAVRQPLEAPLTLEARVP